MRHAPVVMLGGDDLAVLAEFDLAGGTVAVSPEVLEHAAAGASATARRSDDPAERAEARSAARLLGRRRLVWRRGEAVRISARGEVALQAAGLGDRFVLVAPSVVICAAHYLGAAPEAGDLAELVRGVVDAWTGRPGDGSARLEGRP